MTEVQAPVTKAVSRTAGYTCMTWRTMRPAGRALQSMPPKPAGVHLTCTCQSGYRCCQYLFTPPPPKTHTHTHTHTYTHLDRRPLSKTCALHGLPPCPRCTLMQRGVRHCCARGHHKVSQSVCTSTQTHQVSRTARRPTQMPMPALPRLLTLPPDALTTCPTHAASPRTTETQVPPSPLADAPLLQGTPEDEGMNVARPLFRQGHRRAETEIT